MAVREAIRRRLRGAGQMVPIVVIVKGRALLERGEDPTVQLPSNWRQLVRDQCDRLGWKSVYQDEPPATHEAPEQVQ